MRVPSETIRCVQTVVDGTTYTAKRGFFDMPDDHAKTYLKASEQAAPSLAGTGGRGLGYRCTNPACGFGSYFTTCYRCKSPCIREVPDAPGPQEPAPQSAPELAAGGDVVAGAGGRGPDPRGGVGTGSAG